MKLNLGPNSGLTTFPYGVALSQDNGDADKVTNTIATFGLVSATAYAQLTTQTSGTYSGKVYGALTLPTSAVVRNMRFYILGGGISSSNGFSAIAYNGSNLYVAASNTGGGLSYSATGLDWTQSATNTGSFNKVRYITSLSLFVAIGGSNNGLWSSTDGINWTQSAITTGNYNDVFDDGTTIVVASASNLGLYTSTNGTSWTHNAINTGNFNKVYYANSIWVALSGSNLGIYYGSNGTSWTHAATNTGNFFCVCNDGTNFFVGSASNLGILYSAAGALWTATTVIAGSFNDLINNGTSLYLAASSNGGGIISSTSPTAGAWTIATTANAGTGTGFNRIALSGGNYIAVSAVGTGLLYSANGTAWSSTTITQDSWYRVYNLTGNLWLATSATDGIASSANGTSWNIFAGTGAIGNVEISIASAGNPTTGNGPTIPTYGNLWSAYPLSIAANGSFQTIDMNTISNYNLVNDVPLWSTIYVVSDSAFTIAAGGNLFLEVEYYFQNTPA